MMSVPNLRKKWIDRKPYIWCFLTGILLTISQEAQASFRLVDRFGVYGSFVGDPVPSILGVNLAYNLGDIARVHAGVGSLATGISNGMSYGGGAKFFVPGWSFTPFAGAQYTILRVDSFLGLSVPGGANSSAGVLSVGGGVDWQTGFGLNLSAGAYLPVTTTGAQVVPQISLGWFF
jgi:hypothetical protein